MNKIKSLFFAFLMAILMSSTTVASTTSSSVDLLNFFNFDIGQSWSFSSYASSGNVPVDAWKESVTSGKCYEDVDCVRHYYPDFSAKYRLNSNGDVVVYKVDGDFVDDLVVLSDGPVSQLVPEVAFKVFGIDWVKPVNDVSAANMTCDTELIYDVKHDWRAYDVLIQKCAFVFTDQWGEQTIDVARYFFEYEGLMQSVVVYNSTDNEIVPVQFDEQAFLGNFNFAGEYNWNPTEVDGFFFTDVTDSHKNYEAIVFMFQEGIMSGYQDGTFGASKRINRAELLKVLVEATGPTPSLSKYHGCFVDAVGEWYEAYACYGKKTGLISGYPNGKFQGSDPVNKVEALKMILNAFDVKLVKDVEVKPFSDVDLNAWYAPYVSTAKGMGLLEMEKFYILDIHADMRRGEVAETIYRLMEGRSEGTLAQ